MTRLASKSSILLASALTLFVSQSIRAETAAPPDHGRHEAHHGENMGGGDPIAMLIAALNLTPDQQSQIQAIFEATKAQAREVSDDKTLSRDERMAKMKLLHETALAKTKALLTPDQLKKFNEVQSQLPHGPGMHGHDHGPEGDPVAMFSTALNLTPDQQTQIRAILETVHPQMKVIEDDTTLSKDDQAARMSELHDATHAKIRALLTADQAQKFDELLRQKGWHRD